MFGHGMQKTINTDNLKVDMYVILPVSWYQHPFVKNEFLIKSQEQIEKISESGITEVILDTKRSKLSGNQESRDTQSESEQTANPPVSRTIIPDGLLDAIHDVNLPPQEKAKAVRAHSITMISNLLENPTAENMRDC